AQRMRGTGFRERERPLDVWPDAERGETFEPTTFGLDEDPGAPDSIRRGLAQRSHGGSRDRDDEPTVADRRHGANADVAADRVEDDVHALERDGLVLVE